MIRGFDFLVKRFFKTFDQKVELGKKRKFFCISFFTFLEKSKTKDFWDNKRPMHKPYFL